MKKVSIGVLNNNDDLSRANLLAEVLIKDACDTKIIPLTPPKTTNASSINNWLENQLVFTRFDIYFDSADDIIKSGSKHINKHLLSYPEALRGINGNSQKETQPFGLWFLTKNKQIFDKINDTFTKIK